MQYFFNLLAAALLPYAGYVMMTSASAFAYMATIYIYKL